MPKSSDVNTELLIAALDAFKQEYDRLAKTWEQLDLKAQGTVAIAGIFLGGIFAFITNLRPSETTSKVALILAIVSLVLSVLFSLLALRVREVLDAPGGSDIQQFVRDLRNCSRKNSLSGCQIFLRNN